MTPAPVWGGKDIGGMDLVHLDLYWPFRPLLDAPPRGPADKPVGHCSGYSAPRTRYQPGLGT